MKLKSLLYCTALFFIHVHGMDEAQAKLNKTQIISAIEYGVRINNSNNHYDKYITYFKSSSATYSAQEMYAATKGIIEDFASKIEEINDKNGNAAYFLLYPNKKLGHSDGDEVWNQEVILKAYEAPFGKWEWRSDAVHSNPAASSVFFTDWGSKNCKGIIYNIPNNNIIPMEHHITQIRGAQRCNVPMVINIDSAIQDESFFKKLLDEKVIRATFGTQDKLPAPSFWASLFKNKTFKYGSIGLFITLILYDCYRFAWWYYYAQCLGYPTCFKLFLPSLLRELSDFCYRVRYI